MQFYSSSLALFTYIKIPSFFHQPLFLQHHSDTIELQVNQHPSYFQLSTLSNFYLKWFSTPICLCTLNFFQHPLYAHLRTCFHNCISEIFHFVVFGSLTVIAILVVCVTSLISHLFEIHVFYRSFPHSATAANSLNLIWFLLLNYMYSTRTTRFKVTGSIEVMRRVAICLR